MSKLDEILPSAISCWSPSSRPVAYSFKWANSKDFHSSSSVWWLNGSKFSLNDPENKTGSENLKIRVFKLFPLDAKIGYSSIFEP